jgi:hypothetical protein
MNREHVMDATKTRGSERILEHLFGAGSPVSRDELAKAVAAAQDQGFKIVRWWWKGQPAIDQIKAVLQLTREQLGSAVQQILDSQTAETQVGVEVFPLGIPKPEIMQLDLTINRNVQKLG